MPVLDYSYRLSYRFKLHTREASGGVVLNDDWIARGLIRLASGIIAAAALLSLFRLPTGLQRSWWDLGLALAVLLSLTGSCFGLVDLTRRRRIRFEPLAKTVVVATSRLFRKRVITAASSAVRLSVHAVGVSGYRTHWNGWAVVLWLDRTPLVLASFPRQIDAAQWGADLAQKCGLSRPTAGPAATGRGMCI